MENEFEYERRFYCHQMPQEFDDGTAPIVIIQSYYVHKDNYALRVRLQSRNLRIEMSHDMKPLDVLEEYRNNFNEAYVTVKGPVVGGTRYESEHPIDAYTAGELIKRGGVSMIKNRFSAWIGEDGWSIDIFGGDNYPLIIAEAERSRPVTNLTIPKFCVTEITNQARFSNDGLAQRPFDQWYDSFENELQKYGPHFEDTFGQNIME